MRDRDHADLMVEWDHQDQWDLAEDHLQLEVVDIKEWDDSHEKLYTIY